MLSQVLPGRIRPYDSADLDHLCLGGLVAWGRLYYAQADSTETAVGARRRRQMLTRQAPLAFVLREDLPFFAEPAVREAAPCDLGRVAADVLEALRRRGASFATDLARTLRLLPIQVEAALWELVARGLVSGDGVAGLRSLLHRGPARRRRFRVARAAGIASGRWSLWQAELPDPSIEQRREVIARQLLRRYGVVFRELLARETGTLPWRVLLQTYRRWEAAGEIRGGRFVDGVVGEQYAMPAAVEGLRAVRRQEAPGERVIVSAADPLNLVGILTPGARVPATSGDVIVYLAGLPAATGPLGAVRSHLQPFVA